MGLPRGKKIYYVSGYLPNNAKKLCEFYFGDFFVSVKLNQKGPTYDIFLRETLIIANKERKITEFVDIDYFKSYWGSQWRLFYDKIEEID